MFNKNKTIETFLLIGLFLLALGIVFNGILFKFGMIPGYRDASHFYYPLFVYLQDCFAHRDCPFWSGSYNLGFPLGANLTTGLFYPPTYLLLLPIPTWAVFDIYIIGHIILAFCTMYFCTRQFRRSPQASFLAAISYSLGGIVLFEYCNLIFLVSAAWLPLGIYAVDKAVRFQTLKSVLFAGFVMAAITLGGDIQTAYHLGLIAVIVTAVRIINQRRLNRQAIQSQQAIALPCSLNESNPIGRIYRSALVLAGLAITAFCLAAIGIIPMLELIANSNRMTSDNSIHQAESKLAFSVPVWRLPEFILSDFSGQQFPVYHRWTDAISGNDTACWVPNLYMGAIVFLLAIVTLRFFRGSPRLIWLSWIFLIALFASMGRFSLGYLLLSLDYWNGTEYFTGRISSGWGGLYGLLSSILPGYGGFRYPGKWLVIAAAAISILAAYGWDKLYKKEDFANRFSILLAVIAAIEVIWFFIARILIPAITVHLSSSIYGPFAGYNPISILISAGLLIVIAVLLRSKRNACRTIILVIISLELAFTGRNLICPIPAWVLNSESGYSTPVQRTYRSGNSWLPESFRQTSSADRETELALWNRTSLFAYNGLSQHAPTCRYEGTLMLKDYAEFLRVGRQNGVSSELPLCSRIMTRENNIVIFTPHKNVLPRVWLEKSDSPVAESLPVVRPDDCNNTIQAESCNRIVIDLFAPQACRLVLADQYYPGWQASISKRKTDTIRKSAFDDTISSDKYVYHGKKSVYRTNAILRAVDLPSAGFWRVEFVFRPISVYLGTVISLISWIGLIILWIAASRKKE